MKPLHEREALLREWEESCRENAALAELEALGPLATLHLDIIDGVYDIDEERKQLKAAQAHAKYQAMPEKDLERELKRIEKEMLDAARNLEFERAAELRDRLYQLKEKLFGVALAH